MPRFIYISKVDEDHSDYNATFNSLRERYGNKIAPVIVPIWDASHKVTGIIDVLNKRAYEMQNLKRVEIQVPEDKAPVIEEFNDALKEAVAETDETLMDRVLEREMLVQVNANYFLKPKTVKAAIRNLKNGKIHLIGSDCHDLISRPHNLGPVRRLMRVYRTEAEFSILEQNAAGLLFPGGTL